MSFWSILFWSLLAILLLTIVSLTFYRVVRLCFNYLADQFITRLFTEPYEKNLWEGVTAMQHFGVHWAVENELRAASGKALHKPIGTQLRFPHFDKLLFIPAQLHRRPTDETVTIDLTTVIGKHAQRPLTCSMPIMVSAIGYGVAVSKTFSRALAKGTAMAGTCFNAGVGPVLPEHRQLAHRLVVQYHLASWRPDDTMLQQADMVEILIGKGASAGIASSIPRDTLSDEILRDMGLSPTETGLSDLSVGPYDIGQAADLKELVDTLRQKSQGAPIAIKIAAGHHLELDMMIAVQAGVDVIVLDGAQGGTHKSPAITVDHFGLPTLSALCRGVRFLTENKLQDRIDLIVSGGFHTPGDILKALSLGARAVRLGTGALFAAAHVQVVKTLPFEPPTQLVWANGSLRDQFDEEEGALSLSRFLTSYSEELKIGIRALGKTTLKELSREDLVAWDAEAARITGLPLI